VKKSTISIGNKRVILDIADSPDLRTVGLMNRLALDENSGMLFVFDECKPRSFWMKETYIPLSIAYLDEAGKILNIEKMAPLDPTGVRSSRPARYALEMNEGWFEKNGVTEGDVIPVPGAKPMNEQKLRRLIREILKEGFVSHSDEPRVGDEVVNNNTGCKHYQSRGEVLDIKDLDDDMGKAIVYRCRNSGDNWDVGDILAKTMDQLTRIK
jgi:uncharacterized membrane protein (UPF0127 family)